MNTTTGSVTPVDGAPGGGGRGPRRRRWLVVAALGVTLAALGAGFVTIPYYALMPGEAVEVAPLVTVEDGHAFPPEGEVYLPTVALREVTLLGALRGWLDPAIDVVAQRSMLAPKVSSDELRSFNLALMDDSKQSAMVAAFRALGYDPISGNGAEVVEVAAGSPTDGVLDRGETLVAVGGTEVSDHYEALDQLAEMRPGDRAELSVVSGSGAPVRTQVVTLGARPDASARPWLGVTLRTRDVSIAFPFDVAISSDRIGGPSAGLAFALEVIDVLTEGELTGGRRVAATGTIELDGSVGEVGGVAQKAVTVKGAGIDLFLVPRADLTVARRLVGEDLRVEPVDSLGDALSVLARAGGDGVAVR